MIGPWFVGKTRESSRQSNGVCRVGSSSQYYLALALRACSVASFSEVLASVNQALSFVITLLPSLSVSVSQGSLGAEYKANLGLGWTSDTIMRLLPDSSLNSCLKVVALRKLTMCPHEGSDVFDVF